MSNNQIIRNLAEMMRDEMAVKDTVLSLIKSQAMTIPEIAQALGFSRREVTLWIMALWRYGLVVEKGSPDENGYCSYQAKG